MSIGARSVPPSEESPGGEDLMDIAGEERHTFHGTLAHEMCDILCHAEPNSTLSDDLERPLAQAFPGNVTVKVSGIARGQLLFANNAVHAWAGELLARLDTLATREMIAGLEATIAQRQQQGDYWPEGRLNLGIAYACLGEYDGAKRWLEDATNMLRYPSYVQRGEQMTA